MKLLLAFKYGAWKQIFRRHAICFRPDVKYWVYHFGPIKLVVGKKRAEFLQSLWYNGLVTGLDLGHAKDFIKQNDHYIKIWYTEPSSSV